MTFASVDASALLRFAENAIPNAGEGGGGGEGFGGACAPAWEGGHRTRETCVYRVSMLFVNVSCLSSTLKTRVNVNAISSTLIVLNALNALTCFLH